MAWDMELSVAELKLFPELKRIILGLFDLYIYIYFIFLHTFYIISSIAWLGENTRDSWYVPRASSYLIARDAAENPPKDFIDFSDISHAYAKESILLRQRRNVVLLIINDCSISIGYRSPPQSSCRTSGPLCTYDLEDEDSWFRQFTFRWQSDECWGKIFPLAEYSWTATLPCASSFSVIGANFREISGIKVSQCYGNATS